MKRFLMIICLSIFSWTAFAATGNLVLNNDKRIYKTGEIITGTLQIVNATKELIDFDYSTLNGKNLTDFFFLAETSNPRINSNNADVYEVDVLMVIKSLITDFDKSYEIKIGDEIIPTKVSSMMIEKSDAQKNPKFVLYNQHLPFEWPNPYWLIPIFFAAMVVFSLTMKFVAKKRAIRKIANERRERRLYWFNKMANALSRENCEEVYKNRILWKEFISEDRLHQFELVMNDHQFKKELSDDELQLIVAATKELNHEL